MSIYSGFATRNQESVYNRKVSQLIHLFQISLLSFIKHGKAYSESVNINQLSKSFNKLLKSLRIIEQHKHLEPKFSEYCFELSNHLVDDTVTYGQASNTTINSDLDFHILNDVLAYDSNRTASRNGKKSVPPIRKFRNEGNKGSRRSLRPQGRNIQVKGVQLDNRFLSLGTRREKKRIDAAQLYHDQAMGLIYTGLD